MINCFVGIRNNRAKLLKAALAIKGVKQSTIAKDAKVTKSTVSNVIHGRRKSKKVEDVLKKYGVPVKYLAR